MKYANVIIGISKSQLDRPFTYKVPAEMRDFLHPGSYVQVPFGKGDTIREGYIVGFSDTAAYPDEKIKSIQGICARGAEDTGDMAVQLAAWMKRRYGSTMITALKTVLTSRKQAKPAETKEVSLLLGEKEAEAQLAVYEKKHQVARHRLLKELMAVPRQPYSLIIDKLHVTAATMRAMQEQGILEIITTKSLRNPVTLENVGESTIKLSPNQQRIVDGVLCDFKAIRDARQEWERQGDRDPESLQYQNSVRAADLGPGSAASKSRRVSLIHGITGSGKTEVYITIIEKIVEQGAQAIMLIPEISLTYQTLIRFYRHFGERVSVMNSSLSESEKSDQFERARQREIDVIIGPRSALFTPFPNIGAIIIDEEHEGSYKNESMPKYHAKDVAVRIAEMHGAVVVLGSATPSLDSYDKAVKGHYRLYELQERLTGGTLPDVLIADMRSELRNGNKTILSRQLQELISDRLEKKEQIMLFLNRRGYSGFVSCRSCGHVMKCPHCDVSLSLHRNGRLVCHYCGYEEPNVSVCPECGSRFISGFRAGTESVEESVQKMYPQARILRMDADTTKQKGSYEKLLSSFANEEADILIGTQMIVKGHDFPKVTLVGILLADLSLYVGDYRASERTFQLLTQAAGRAGRGQIPGNVVIQTYEPEHYSIQYSSRQDYTGFYQEEIRYRQMLMYPPSSHMLAVQIMSKNEDRGQSLAGQIRDYLEKKLGRSPRARVIGPASAAIGKIRDEYRFVLYIKCGKYDTLIACKDGIEEGMERMNASGAAQDITVQFDFDPVSPF